MEVVLQVQLPTHRLDGKIWTTMIRAIIKGCVVEAHTSCSHDVPPNDRPRGAPDHVYVTATTA